MLMVVSGSWENGLPSFGGEGCRHLYCGPSLRFLYLLFVANGLEKATHHSGMACAIRRHGASNSGPEVSTEKREQMT
jgi:hypothetical protein